jgi:hypothetical protein
MTNNNSYEPPFDAPQSVNDGDFNLSQNAWGQLVFTDAHGQRHEDVVPVRAFPITDPSHFLSLCDNRGAELAVCNDLATLPVAARELIEGDLSRRDFIPEIQRIIHITSGLASTEWTVETDRGRTTFVVDGEESVRRLGLHQATVTDTHRMRYLIRDLRSLDAPSRHLLERFL